MLQYQKIIENKVPIFIKRFQTFSLYYKVNMKVATENFNDEYSRSYKTLQFL